MKTRLRGWQRGYEREKRRRRRAWREEVSGCVCSCVWWKEREGEKSDSLARQKNPRSPQSLQSAGLMHIQPSISPHCPSFLINALLVGVNKHIHSGPKKLPAHCVSKKSKRGNAASTLYLQQLFITLKIITASSGQVLPFTCRFKKNLWSETKFYSNVMILKNVSVFAMMSLQQCVRCVAV